MRPKWSWASSTAARDSVVVAHVGDERQALRGHLVAQALELVGRAHPVGGVLERLRDVERDDVVAVLGQREGDGAALAVGGARDQRDRAAHAA